MFKTLLKHSSSIIKTEKRKSTDQVPKETPINCSLAGGKLEISIFCLLSSGFGVHNQYLPEKYKHSAGHIENSTEFAEQNSKKKSFNALLNNTNFHTALQQKGKTMPDKFFEELFNSFSKILDSNINKISGYEENVQNTVASFRFAFSQLVDIQDRLADEYKENGKLSKDDYELLLETYDNFTKESDKFLAVQNQEGSPLAAIDELKSFSPYIAPSRFLFHSMSMI